jgi:hypothetical protein
MKKFFQALPEYAVFFRILAILPSFFSEGFLIIYPNKILESFLKLFFIMPGSSGGKKGKHLSLSMVFGPPSS